MTKPINNITDEDIGEFVELPTLFRYQKIATKSAIYPSQKSSLGLMYCALKLNGEAGELAEHVGKALRDDNLVPSGISDDGEHLADIGHQLSPDRRDLIIKEMSDILWYLSAICNELDTELDAVALANLLKLKSRAERDKLQGSGDDR
jgi:NTP pyrophosphatase (non-canonical NTP hydrolase)